MFSLLLACAGAPDDSEALAPALEFVAPTDGSTVGTTIDIAVVVENFVLNDPALDNDDGETRSGYITFYWEDGGAQMTESTGETTASITLTATGETTIDAELIYDDGGSLEPAVTASVTVNVQPGG